MQSTHWPVFLHCLFKLLQPFLLSVGHVARSCDTFTLLCSGLACPNWYGLTGTVHSAVLSVVSTLTVCSTYPRY